MKVSEPILPMNSSEMPMTYHLQSVLEDLFTEIGADQPVAILRPGHGEIQVRDIPADALPYYLAGVCEAMSRLSTRIKNDLPFGTEIEPETIYDDAQAALGLSLFRRMTFDAVERGGTKRQRQIREWQMKVRQFRSNLERSYAVFLSEAIDAGDGDTLKIPADMAMWWMRGDAKIVRAFVCDSNDSRLSMPVRLPLIRLRSEARSLERFCEKVTHRYAAQLRRAGQKKGVQDGKAA